MSALRKPHNDIDALEDCWTPIGVAASAALNSIAHRREEARRDFLLLMSWRQNQPENIDTVDEDREAMREIEGRA